MDIIFKDESYRIIGACFEVYNEKGCGFVEPVYQECLEIEAELQSIPYETQKVLPLDYKGRTLRQVYVPDFICFDKIIVELKAVSKLIDEPVHRFTTISKPLTFDWDYWLTLATTPGSSTKESFDERILARTTDASQSIQFV